MEPSHYETLGVDQSATSDEIRRAYKARALEVHPDKASPEDKQASEARFHRVHEAFQVLRDPYKRKMYDAQQGFRPRSSYSFDGELSEAQRNRKQDREQWAQKSWQECEDRIRNLRARAAEAREERMRREQAATEYRQMVERMLAELYKKNPEWAERRQKIRRTQSSPLSS